MSICVELVSAQSTGPGSARYLDTTEVAIVLRSLESTPTECPAYLLLDAQDYARFSNTSFMNLTAEQYELILPAVLALLAVALIFRHLITAIRGDSNEND